MSETSDETRHNNAVDWAKAQLTPAIIAQAKLAIKSLGGTITPEQLAVYSLTVGRRAREEAEAESAQKLAAAIERADGLERELAKHQDFIRDHAATLRLGLILSGEPDPKQMTRAARDALALLSREPEPPPPEATCSTCEGKRYIIEKHGEPLNKKERLFPCPDCSRAPRPEPTREGWK